MSEQGYIKAENKDSEQEFNRSRWIKFGFTVAAVAIGSYYGAGRYMVRNTKELKKVSTNLYSIGEFLSEQSDSREAFLNAQRRAITAARAAGSGFTYYPGLGVLHHAIESSKS